MPDITLHEVYLCLCCNHICCSLYLWLSVCCCSACLFLCECVLYVCPCSLRVCMAEWQWWNWVKLSSVLRIYSCYCEQYFMCVCVCIHAFVIYDHMAVPLCQYVCFSSHGKRPYYCRCTMHFNPVNNINPMSYIVLYITASSLVLHELTEYRN